MSSILSLSNFPWKIKFKCEEAGSFFKIEYRYVWNEIRRKTAAGSNEHENHKDRSQTGVALGQGGRRGDSRHQRGDGMF